MKLKKLSKLMAVLLGAVLLVGCAAGNGGGTAPAAPLADEPAVTDDATTDEANDDEVGDDDANGEEVALPETTLDTDTVDIIRVWTDSTVDRDVRMEQAEIFNQTIGQELGIIVEYTVQGADWHNLIRIAAQSGEAPQIFRPNGQFLPDFVEAGFFRPLTEVPGMEDFLALYAGVPQVDSQVQIFGDVFTLPFHLTTYKFAINRDIFDRNNLDIPASWDDVREAARIITENGNGTEFGYGIGKQSLWSATTYITRQNQQNVGHFGFDNNALRFDFSSMEPAFAALQGMVADGSMFPGFEGMDAQAIGAQFVEGRIGIVAAASFDVPNFDDADINIEIIDIPTFDGGPRPFRQFADATNVFAMGENAFENERILEKSRIVFEWLHSDEIGAALFEAGSVIPFRQEAIDMAASAPVSKLVEFTIPPDDFIGMIPSIENMVSIEGMSFQETLMSIMAAGQTSSAAEILQELDDRMNAAMEAQFDADFLELYRAPATWDPTP